MIGFKDLSFRKVDINRVRFRHIGFSFSVMSESELGKVCFTVYWGSLDRQ